MGAAVPVLFTAIGGAAAAAATSVWVSAAITIATTMIASELTKQGSKKRSLQSDALGRLETRSTAIEGERSIYGEVRLSGPYADFRQNGEFVDLTILFALHEVEAIRGIWFDDTYIPIEHIHPDGMVGGGTDYASKTWVRRYTGSPTQVVDQILFESYTDYTEDHHGRGCSYLAIRFERNEKLQGLPNSFTALVKGKKIYDPRRDSSVGGVGSHRFADATSWEWSNNPALCLADYLTDPWSGMGIDPDNVDWVTVSHAANVCDEPVQVPDGTQKRYTCNGVVTAGTAHGEIVNQLVSSMAGRVCLVGDKVRVFAGEYTPAVLHITEDDVVGESCTYRPYAGLDDRFNVVRGTYIDPDREWTAVEFHPMQDDLALTQDGVRRESELTLPFTTNEYTAQLIALQLLRRSRDGAVLSLTLDPTIAYRLTPNDNVVVTISTLGIESKVFNVVEVGLADNLTATVTLRSISPHIFEWSLEDAKNVNLPPRYEFPRYVPRDIETVNADVSQGAVTLTWSDPVSGRTGVEFIDIHRGDTNIYEQSDVIASVQWGTQSYTETIRPGDQRFYWVRVRSINGTVSENPSSPVEVIGFGQNIYRQATEPQNSVAGDVWVDTDDGDRLYLFDGNSWHDISTNDIQTAIDALSGNITIWYQEGQPTNPRLLDRWYRPSDGARRVYIPRTSSSPIWADRPNDAILENFARNLDATSLLDGKAVVVTSSIEPANPDIGDYWIDTDENPRRFRQWNGTSWILHAMGEKVQPLAGLGPNAKQIGDNQAGSLGWVLIHTFDSDGLPSLNAREFTYQKQQRLITWNTIKKTTLDPALVVYDTVQGDSNRPGFNIDQSATGFFGRRRHAFARFRGGWEHENGLGDWVKFDSGLNSIIDDIIVLGEVTAANIGNGPFITTATSSGLLKNIGHAFFDEYGQIGDTRTLPNIVHNNIGSVQYRLPSGGPVCVLAGDGLFGDVRCDIISHLLQMPWGPVTYNSGTVWGLDADTEYHIYTDDPAFAGGVVTYLATTDPRVITSENSRYYVGTVFTGNGTDRVEVTGGAGCVARHMIVGTSTADQLVVGDIVDQFTLEAVGEVVSQPGVRITSDSGAVLICSRRTPFEIAEGKWLFANQMNGMPVLVKTSSGLQWERCTVELLTEMIEVVPLCFGGKSFPAGETPERQIFSHNGLKG